MSSCSPYCVWYILDPKCFRYGRQTVAGLIKDGMSAISRYYLNNFHDGVRQASCVFMGFDYENHSFRRKKPVLLICFNDFYVFSGCNGSYKWSLYCQ